MWFFDALAVTDKYCKAGDRAVQARVYAEGERHAAPRKGAQ
jgi:hypothetical protein